MHTYSKNTLKEHKILCLFGSKGRDISRDHVSHFKLKDVVNVVKCVTESLEYAEKREDIFLTLSQALRLAQHL